MPAHVETRLIQSVLSHKPGQGSERGDEEGQARSDVHEASEAKEHHSERGTEPDHQRSLQQDGNHEVGADAASAPPAASDGEADVHRPARPKEGQERAARRHDEHTRRAHAEHVLEVVHKREAVANQVLESWQHVVQAFLEHPVVAP